MFDFTPYYVVISLVRYVKLVAIKPQPSTDVSSSSGNTIILSWNNNTLSYWNRDGNIGSKFQFNDQNITYYYLGMN